MGRIASLDRINIVSERNLKNIATRRLETLVSQPDSANKVRADLDRLMLLEMPYNMGESCPAIGNINLRDGHLVPRCGSILAAFVEKAAERLYAPPRYDLVLIGFARNAAELRQTEFGMHLYTQSLGQ